MMESLVFFVLVAAILVIFLHDFGKLLKKLFAIPGVALFFPLLLVSYILVSFESFFLWLLLKIQIALIGTIAYIAAWLPFTLGADVLVSVVLLMVITFLPMLAIQEWNRRRMFQAIPNVWMFGMFIWIGMGMLLSLSLV